MAHKLIKKIWFIGLCLASLSLAGCFHIPDEDRLPSKNKVDISGSQEDIQVEEALNSFMDWLEMVSSWQNEKKSNELNEIEINEDETPVDTENESINDESEAEWFDVIAITWNLE